MAKETIKIKCPQCETQYRIKLPGSKIPAGTVKCRKCTYRIQISEAVRQQTASGNQDIFKCPKCGQQQAESLEECAKCGLIFKKYKSDSIDPLIAEDSDHPDQPDSADDTRQIIKRKLTSIAIQYVVDHLKGTSIAVIVILIVSIVFGGIPLLSALFDQDDEVMFFTQAAHCNQYKTFLRKTSLFQIVIGNTGENHQDKVTVHLRNIPCSTDQVYYSVQNLEATSERQFDPNVGVRCSDGISHKCHKFVGLFGNSSVCELLSQLGYVIEMAEEMEDDDVDEYWDMALNSSDPQEHGYVFPCLGEEGDRTFEIENFAAGTLIRFGFITRDYESLQASWRDMKGIEVDILTDAEIVEGNPQATVFARIINSVLDIF